MTESLQSGKPPASGSGTLTVIKAGPGYHSQKTYNFGPEGVKSKTEEQTGKDVGKDMRKSIYGQSYKARVSCASDAVVYLK